MTLIAIRRADEEAEQVACGVALSRTMVSTCIC